MGKRSPSGTKHPAGLDDKVLSREEFLSILLASMPVAGRRCAGPEHEDDTDYEWAQSVASVSLQLAEAVAVLARQVDG